MICKGTTHNNGARLASYITTGKKGERAELWELRGFEATDIKDAFRDVHVMADGTKCEQPFFHVQVRNREGETLTRQQWEHTADRIERMLGLKDQPRAIAFHIDEQSGCEHMHVVWSRIHEETLTAIPLPFFKDRLKKLSRELEMHFALDPVTNQREGQIKYAPTRAEEEQARRLGLNIHDVRNTIRACYERSDCGASFQAALEHEGMALAQGERRDFVVIDEAGGIHALGKRILDVTAAKVRDRLSDLSRDELPTIEMARAFVHDLGLAKNGTGMPAQPWDRDREDRAWQEAVINAAIKKEEAERNFVESAERVRGPEGSRKTEFGRDGQGTSAPPDLGRTAAEIRLAYSLTNTGQEFADALEDRGLILACMTEADARRLNKWERQRLKEQQEAAGVEQTGNERNPKQSKDRYRAGELVVVNQYGDIYQLTANNTGDGLKARNEHLSDIDRSPLLSVSAAESVMKALQQHRQEERQVEAQQARNERNAPVAPPKHQSWPAFDRAAEDATHDRRAENLKGAAAQVWAAWRQSDSDKAITAASSEKTVSFSVPTKEAFAASLDEKGIMFARTTKEEAERSQTQAAFAKEIGRYAPRFKEGEIVIVSEPRPECQRNGEIIEPSRVQKLDPSLAEKFVKHLETRSQLQGVDATLKLSNLRAQQRSAEIAEKRMDSATSPRDFSRTVSGNIRRSVGVGNHTLRAIAKTVDAVGNAVESLFAPTLTPQQIREAERTNLRREAEAESSMDLSRYTAERTHHTQQQENEREAERQRQRDRGGRER